MNTIWKYELQITDVQTLSVPSGAFPLKVGIQKRTVDPPDELPEGWAYYPVEDEVPVIWMKVNPDLTPVDVVVRIVGTGHSFDPDKLWYVGTFQQQQRSSEFVGHVFMEAGL